MGRVYASFRALVEAIVRVELWAAIVLFALTGAIVALQVFARRALDNPFVWAEDLTVFLFVWTSFLGAAVLYDRRTALSIDTLTSRLGRRVRERLGVVVDVVLLVALVYLTLLSYDFVLAQQRLGHKLGGATGIPSYMMTLAVLVGVATMVLSTLAAVMKHCVAGADRQAPVRDEDAPRASAADSR